MPKIFTPEQRAEIIPIVLEGLRKGTPLTVLCSAPGMPCDDTIRKWGDDDDALSRAIARAREIGYDAIAAEGLAIVDNVEEDPASRRVRSEYRLKLLAKWDPKRYGDKVQNEHTGADGGAIQIEQRMREDVDAVASAIASLAERARAAAVVREPDT